MVPSLALKERYNDNIYLTPTDPMGDFITTVSTAAEMVNNTERFESTVSANVDHHEFMSHRDLNGEDQAYKGKFKFGATPLLNISGAASYLTDTLPDRDLQTTGIVLSGLRRNRTNASLSTDYQATEKTVTNLSYYFTRETYDKKLTDFNGHTVSFGLEYDLEKYITRTKGRILLSYDNYTFSLIRLDAVTGMIGFSRTISEKFSFSVDGGLRQNWSSFTASQVVQVSPTQVQVVPVQQQSSIVGWVGKTTLSYKGERTTANVSYVKDVAPASGYGGATERNSLGIDASHRLSYEWYLNAGITYFTNKTDALQYGVTAIDTTTVSPTVGLRYEHSRDFSIDVNYTYTYLNNRISYAQAAGRNLFYILLTFQHAFLQ